MSYPFAFILFMGFSMQEYWSGMPFPSPVDHILSDLSTMSHLSWVVLHGMGHNFTELDKLWSMWSDWLVVCNCGFSLSALWFTLLAPTVLLGFLLPSTWGVSSWLLQQSTTCIGHCPWTWTCGSSWPFHYRGLECKRGKSRNIWSNANLTLEYRVKQGKG